MSFLHWLFFKYLQFKIINMPKYMFWSDIFCSSLIVAPCCASGGSCPGELSVFSEVPLWNPRVPRWHSLKTTGLEHL